MIHTPEEIRAITNKASLSIKRLGEALNNLKKKERILPKSMFHN